MIKVQDNRSMDDDAPWLLEIADEDIVAARDAWLVAQENGHPPERVELLWEDLGRLLRAQVQQFLVNLAEEHRDVK